MRRTGLIDSVVGLGRHDHACWTFGSTQEYRQMAQQFLNDALEGGARVLFLGDAEQVAGFDQIDGMAARRDAGAAQFRDLSFYRQDGPFDPVAQVQAYVRATEAAVADGYTGLSVAVDVTPLVDTDAGRAAFARYEHLADAFMAGHPMSALCAVDRRQLGPAAVAELACMHPLAPVGATPLRVHSSAEPGVAAVLAGEVDLAGHALLQTALRRAALRPVDGVVTLDARPLTFIDHRGLLMLAAHVRDLGAATVLLVRRGSGLPQLADLLGVADLRVVVDA